MPLFDSGEKTVHEWYLLYALVCEVGVLHTQGQQLFLRQWYYSKNGVPNWQNTTYFTNQNEIRNVIFFDSFRNEFYVSLCFSTDPNLIGF